MEFVRNQNPKKVLNLGEKYRKIYNPNKENWKNLRSGFYLLESTDQHFMKIFWDAENIHYVFFNWRDNATAAIKCFLAGNPRNGYPFDHPITNSSMVVIYSAKMIMD